MLGQQESRNQTEMMGGRTRKVQGTVKWFSNSKGYGFIGRQDGADVFVHYSGIAGGGYRTLQEGDSVEFEIVQGPKGLQANNVTKIGIYAHTGNRVPTPTT